MSEASEREEYERAAHLRDAARTVETLGAWRNKMEAPSMGDRDAFGVKVGPSGAVVEVFQMRRGRIADRVELVTEREPQWLEGGHPSEQELVQIGLQQFYAERQPPPEVHTPVELPAEDRDAIEAWLAERAGRRVKVRAPKRGEHRGLLDLAARNAAIAYQSHFAEGGSSAFDAIETLRAKVNLPALPRRIECFDISTFQGKETVASMVVAVDGRMRKGEYRKYKIRHERPDDFSAMHEVVLRRYQRVVSQGGPFPDLIVIDGGKGQLSAAYAALREVGLDRLIAIGLAKEEELIFTRDRVEGIALPRESSAFAAAAAHSRRGAPVCRDVPPGRRAKRDFASTLDEIRGIGPRRRRQLLTAFGSLAGVRRASRVELAAVVGDKAAQAVIPHFTT
jgi:excinuclease ABC subunit C